MAVLPATVLALTLTSATVPPTHMPPPDPKYAQLLAIVLPADTSSLPKEPVTLKTPPWPLQHSGRSGWWQSGRITRAVAFGADH